MGSISSKVMHRHDFRAKSDSFPKCCYQKQEKTPALASYPDINNTNVSVVSLSQLQKQLVCDTWSHVEDKLKFTQTVVKKIFDPNAKEMVLDESSVFEEEMSKSNLMSEKAVNLLTFVNLVVDCLGEHEDDIPMVVERYRHNFPDHKQRTAINEALVDQIEAELGEEYSQTKMSKNIKTAWTALMTDVSLVRQT